METESTGSCKQVDLSEEVVVEDKDGDRVYWEL